jgi:1-deoxy-D-xylulose-5-phosphate reductoisomerase
MLAEPPVRPARLCILGSTGSIGTQTLDIVRLFPGRFAIDALTAGENVDLLARQAAEFRPRIAVVANEERLDALRRALEGTGVEARAGAGAVREAAAAATSDTVVAAMVGFAGLAPTLEAIAAGKKIALANKESLVVAGELVRERARASGSRVIPVDSEHSAIFQCLVGEDATGVERLVLTASGGPFRTRARDTFASITREEALSHPNWSMGSKITVDSATMMNKGLEVIEARWLFDLPADCIHVVVHPQSIVHSMVEFVDGSTKAQMGVPDMKVPIQYALTFPERWPAPHERIDWKALRRLDFEEVDSARFPCVELAFEALRAGGTAAAVLNAANEQAVAGFLADRILFMDIPRLIGTALGRLSTAGPVGLDALLEADRDARRLVVELAGTGGH